MGTLYIKVTQTQICCSAFELDVVLVPDFYVNGVRIVYLLPVKRQRNQFKKANGAALDHTLSWLKIASQMLGVAECFQSSTLR